MDTFKFLAEIFLAFCGIFISWLAFKEARKAFTEARQAKDEAVKAKEAAVKAGKTVKKQSILLTISETIRLCNIGNNTNYVDSNSKLTDINGKVRNVVGLYRDDPDLTHKSILQLIETCSSLALTEFNLLDPESENKFIYQKIRPFIADLTGHLNELQGVLENELISNN